MPHFRLMNEEEMTPETAALLRAKLHVRGGRRRISQNKISAGIAAFHDAFIFAMQRFFLDSKLKSSLISDGNNADLDLVDLYDEEHLFHILKRSGIIDNSFTEEDFLYLGAVLDEALELKTDSFQKEMYYSKYSNIMTQLGVIPFSEDELPPEDPSTY